MSNNLDIRQLKRVRDKMQKLQNKDIEAFCMQCAKELAARLLGKTIKITPTGQYPASSGKVGGTLKNGWTGGKSMNARRYAYTLPVTKVGGVYQIEITDPISYASYVEFGHRTRGGKGWVKGAFMLTISEKQLKTQAPKIIEKKINEYLRECFK